MTSLRTKPDTGTAHTEGPWIAAAGSSSIVGWPVVAQTGRLICNIATPPKDINRIGKAKEEYDAFMAECGANAALIAAAPELLAALKDAASLIERNGFREWPGGSLSSLHAAIAKAEGQS